MDFGLITYITSHILPSIPSATTIELRILDGKPWVWVSNSSGSYAAAWGALPYATILPKK